MHKLLRTASFRFTLFTVGLFATFVVFTFIVSYWIAVRYLVTRVDAEISWQIEMLSEEYQSGSLNPQNPDLVEPGTYLLLQDADGRVIADNFPADLGDRQWLTKLSPKSAPQDNDSQTLRALAVALPDKSRLVVAQDLHDLHEVKDFLGKAFAGLLVAILLLGVVCGVIVSTLTLRRVEKINLTAGDIIKGRLDRRMPLKGTNDEFDRLSHNLNLMLDQIEKLMTGLRQVSTDMAHDLRTPLSRMRQRLEGARRRAKRIEDYEQAVDQALVQNDEILETFSALLSIAQVGSGAYRQGFGAIFLSELFETISETYGPIAEENKQILCSSIEPGLMAHGDNKLMTQMVVNLVENAIRHSPPETRIFLTLSQTVSEVTAVVADTGPGVPKTEREKIFQRFYRLQTSRTTAGSGLGLSLVSAIADLHGIAIMLTDNDPGLRVTLRFPSISTTHL
ncbi:MAG: sensor histidine kinase [Nitrospirales bacterium]